MIYRKLIIIFTSLFLSSAQAHSLKVIGTHFHKIFEYDETTNKYKGVAVDILDLVAAKHGLKLEYESVPWNRAQNTISNGNADIIVGPYRTEERETKMNFIPVPFYNDEMVFYTLKAKPFTWKHKLEDLKSKKFVTIKGWTYGKKFDEEKKKYEHFEANNIESGFKLLQIGRAELLLANERNSKEVLEDKNFRNQFVKVNEPLINMSGYFAFSFQYKNVEVKKIIEKELSLLYKNGTIKKINKQYNLHFDK